MIWYRIFAHWVANETSTVDAARGYVFEVPLDDDMRLVVKDWETSHRPYKVTRFWRGKPTRHGQLLYLFGNSWCIDYGSEVKTAFPIPIGSDRLAIGDDLLIRDIDHHIRTFRIVESSQIRWFPSAHTHSEQLMDNGVRRATQKRSAH